MRQQHPGKSIRFFMCDQMRFGQKGRLVRVWARTGSRPRVLRQNQYDYCYMFGSVDAQSGDSEATITPTCNAGWMNEHLAQLSKRLAADEHAILVLDNAGWHHSKELAVPSNITLLHLPPYCPELNGIERLWSWMKDNDLSNRCYADYATLVEAGQESYDKLTKERVRSLCRNDWVEWQFVRACF